MEGALQFLQTYGLWIALGGSLAFLLTRSGSYCGMSRAPGGVAAGSCHQAPAQQRAQSDQPPTLAELQDQLAQTRAQHADLARQIAVLEAEPADSARARR